MQVSGTDIYLNSTGLRIRSKDSSYAVLTDDAASEYFAWGDTVSPATAKMVINNSTKTYCRKYLLPGVSGDRNPKIHYP